MYIDYLSNVVKPWYYTFSFPLVFWPISYELQFVEIWIFKWKCEQVEECNYNTAACHIGNLVDFCAASIAFSQVGLHTWLFFIISNLFWGLIASVSISKLISCSYLILTNQSTYELVRRRRIPYLRYLTHLLSPNTISGSLKKLKPESLILQFTLQSWLVCWCEALVVWY